MISQFQLFFVIIQTQVGIGIISLPYDVFKISKADAWISILIAGIFIQINIILFWLLHRRFPSLTIFEMLNEIVGKNIALFVKIAYIVYFITTSILLILVFGRMVNLWILPQTPLWIINLLLISVCVFCVKENLRVLARFNVVVSIWLVVLFLLISYVIKDINILYILPVGQSGFRTIMSGAREATFASLGYELLLVLFPYCLGKNSGKLKVALMGGGVVTIFYVYLTILTITYFGPSVMELIPEPILYIMKFHAFQIIERTDLLFFSIWIISVGTSFMMYLYSLSNGLANLFKKTNHSTFAFYAALLIFILTLFLSLNEEVFSSYRKFHSLASYLFTLVIPFILLFVSIVRGKKETTGAVQS